MQSKSIYHNYDGLLLFPFVVLLAGFLGGLSAFTGQFVSSHTTHMNVFCLPFFNVSANRAIQLT